MNPLPPQAYTKETLLKAYAWLMNQSSSIREMATTPDILVSLYLKATRDGDSALDRPSIQNFKNELKNLAGLMGELDRAPGLAIQEDPTSPTKAAPAGFAGASSATAAPTAHGVFSGTATQSASAGASAASTQGAPTASTSGAHSSGTGMSATMATGPRVVAAAFQVQGDSKIQLDLQTLAMIREVKEELNLSSEAEALRMLVKIGYTRAKNLLK